MKLVFYSSMLQKSRNPRISNIFFIFSPPSTGLVNQVISTVNYDCVWRMLVGCSELANKQPHRIHEVCVNNDQQFVQCGYYVCCCSARHVC